MRASVSVSRSISASFSPSSRPALDIGRVGLEDLLAASVDPVGQIAQAGVLGVAIEPCKHMERIPRIAANVLDALGGRGHAQRVNPAGLRG